MDYYDGPDPPSKADLQISEAYAEIKRLEAQVAALRGELEETRRERDIALKGLQQTRAALIAANKATPRFPTLGSMGGGSNREAEMQDDFRREHGRAANTYRDIGAAIADGLYHSLLALQEIERIKR